MTRKLVFFLFMFPAAMTARAAPDDESFTRIARLAYVQGQVSFQHTSDVDWSTASVNLPLQPGDRIYTGPFGRAEIEFDEGSVLRLAEGADVQLLSLKDDLIQYRVLLGLSTLTVSSSMDFEIDTPAAAFNVLFSGIYRIDVYENGEVDAIVRKGELEAANNLFSRRIRSGELLHVRPGENSANDIAQYRRRDEWDEWNDRRHADRYAYAGEGHLPQTVYMGTSELNRYGRWVEVETYGTAWVPLYVDIGWSPYSIGRWCYRPVWGWTWVSYQPWGWLPYHYGRWYFSVGFGWCWLPGPAFSFNFWSPGLVTFYRGPGWVSWCPLGPGDYYNVHHYYFNKRVHGHYLDGMRALHTRHPGDSFNRYARGAFRTARVKDFTDRSFATPEGYANVNNVTQPWRQGSVVEDRLNIRPTAASYSADPARPSARPRSAQTLPTVVRANPAVRSSDQKPFSRITNPETSAQPSRAAMSRENRSNALATDGSGSSTGRSMQAPKPEQSDRAASSSSGSGSGTAPDRRPAAPGSSGGNGGNAERSLSSGRSAARSQSGVAASSNQQVVPRRSYVRQTPTQRSTADTTQNPEPQTDEGSRDAHSSGARSGPRQLENGSSTGNASDSAYSARTYTVPRQSNSLRGSAQSNTSRSYAAPSTRQNLPQRSFERLAPSQGTVPNGSTAIRPRTDVSPPNNSYAIPRTGIDRSGNSSGAGNASRPANPGRTLGVPRQSSPSQSFRQNSINRSGSRSYTSPSVNRGNGNSASAAGRSSGNASSGRAVQSAPRSSSSGGSARSRGK